jgi:hypothetical protein
MSLPDWCVSAMNTAYNKIHTYGSGQPLLLLFPHFGNSIWQLVSFFACTMHVTSIGLARTIYLYTVFIRCFWQGNHHIYGHIRCIYTVLANPTHHTCSFTLGTMRFLTHFAYVMHVTSHNRSAPVGTMLLLTHFANVMHAT